MCSLWIKLCIREKECVAEKRNVHSCPDCLREDFFLSFFVFCFYLTNLFSNICTSWLTAYCHSSNLFKHAGLGTTLLSIFSSLTTTSVALCFTVFCFVYGSQRFGDQNLLVAFDPLEKLSETLLLSLVSCCWGVIFETVLDHKSPQGSTIDSNSSDLDPISRALCCQKFQLPWPYFKVSVHLERTKWKDEFSCSHATEFKLGRIINYVHFEIMHNCFLWLWFVFKGNWCASHVQQAVSKTQCRHCGNRACFSASSKHFNNDATWHAVWILTPYMWYE